MYPAISQVAFEALPIKTIALNNSPTYSGNSLNKEILLEKQRLAIENSMDGIALLNKEGEYYYLNQVHVNMFGYETESELIGLTWRSIYEEHEIRRIEKNIFPDLIANGKWQGETTGKSKNGNPVYQEITLTTLPDKGLLCICRDISEKKRNTELLKLQQQILQNTNSIVIVTNANREIQWVNDAFTKTSGYTLDEVTGKNPGQLLQGAETDIEKINFIREKLNNQEPFTCELQNYKKDGTTYWIEMRCEPLFGANGQLEKFFALQEDITQKKETEKKLRENDIRLQHAIEGINGALWDWDIVNNTVYYSPQWKKNLGYLPHELTNDFSEWESRVHPDDLPATIKAITEYLDGKREKDERHLRIKHKDGRYLHWFDKGIITERDKNGKPCRMVGVAIDISEIKEIQNKLSVSEQRWNFALEGAEAGIVDWDFEKNTVFYSPRILNVIDIQENNNKTPIELLEEVIHPDDLEYARKMLNNLMLHENKVLMQYRVKNKMNEYIWVEDTAIVVQRKKDGTPLRILNSFINITERKKTELELLHSKELAESLVQKERRFLANVSHELRTPLHAVIGLSEQLEKSPLNIQQKEFVGIINESAKHLLELISDVLDLSKISEGKIQLEQTAFSFHKVLIESIQMFDQKVKEKNLTLKTSCPKSSEELVIGDPLRLKQILLNLISNAVKFTDKGSVEICCEKTNSINDKIQFNVSVKDTGIGIDENIIDSIFEDFVQEDKTYARKFGGSGLGLSITQKLVEMMNGTLNIVSKKNQGTTVSISLQFNKMKSTTGDNTEKQLDTSLIPPNIKVLLAEDNNLNRLVAKIILNKHGVYPDEAENGSIVIDKIREGNTYDLILMDIQMPEMDGIEATRYIRNKLKIDVPIIAITANAVKEELDSYIIDGMNDYITKPFDEKTLLSKIQRWVQVSDVM